MSASSRPREGGTEAVEINAASHQDRGMRFRRARGQFFGISHFDSRRSRARSERDQVQNSNSRRCGDSEGLCHCRENSAVACVVIGIQNGPTSARKTDPPGSKGSPPGGGEPRLLSFPCLPSFHRLTKAVAFTIHLKNVAAMRQPIQ